jgi:hypothetical protein
MRRLYECVQCVQRVYNDLAQSLYTLQATYSLRFSDLRRNVYNVYNDF